MAYEVAISFVITEDGKGFHSTNLRYENLNYDDLVELEKLGLSCMAQLGQLGDKKAAAKKQK